LGGIPESITCTMNRQNIGILIAQKLKANAECYNTKFLERNKLQYCYIDDLLPVDLAQQIFESFPAKEEMLLRKNLREFKYMTAQMNFLHPLLEEVVYAFQEPEVIKLLARISGIKTLIPDPNLYAGGISVMPKGGFMNPHIDASHDRSRQYFRVLNLLYYITPDWKPEFGGNLELWPDGLKSDPMVIHNRFNRLVLMGTTHHSLHAVSEIQVEQERCCVVNYYFSPIPIQENCDGQVYYSTSFRGRVGQTAKDLVLRVDGRIRSTLRAVLDPFFRRGILYNPHFYDRDLPTLAKPNRKYGRKLRF
jgi:Rps23 Pro-64 3,4-dihydroxylase Tpa1-like proline 4-hydroxylase